MAQAPGRYRPAPTPRQSHGASPEQLAEMRRLEAIGYASGSQTAPSESGVTQYDHERAQAGVNLYTSGHAAEALLVDMEGTLLHRWQVDFRALWPDFPEKWLHTGAGFFRRAAVTPEGDLLAIFEGIGLVRLDRDSKVLWAKRNKAHHDLQVLPDGSIYVLTREARLVPAIHPQRPILEDFVSVLAPDGTELRRVSLLDALERSAYRDLWAKREVDRFGDIFHTNSLEVLDGRLAGRLPAFRSGNVLTSLLKPDLVAVLDLERGEIVWALHGSFRKQHDPGVLANGNLLLFDNRGAEPPHSRVIEFDPAQPDRIVWEYRGNDERPFGSFNCGAAARLENGNTLITESDAGRALEVTPAGEIVWEFVNPHRAKDDPALIATLFEMVRLPPDFGADWRSPPSATQGNTVQP